MKGKGDQICSVHPHPCLPAGRLTLPHHEGEGFDEGNVKCVWLEFWIYFKGVEFGGLIGRI
jgi:hypothetical protein